MDYLIAVLQLGILIAVYAADLKCPSARQWRLRAQSYCGKEEKYTCLYSIYENEQKYTEGCNGTKKEKPGEKTEFNNRNFHNVDCSEERYQPTAFCTTQGSNCLFLKSTCNEVGQVINDNGSTTEDRTCRCNYAQQYAFVSQHLRNPCNCTPSVEDCSCYKKRCHTGYKLSPDYKCVPENETVGKYNCKEMIIIEKDGKVSKINLTKSGLEEEGEKGRSVFWILLFWKNYDLYDYYILCRTKNLFTHPLSDKDVIEGEDVVLTCEVAIDGLPMEWMKDGEKMVTDDSRYEILSNGTTHRRTITGATAGDVGVYTIQFKNKKSCARVKIHDPFTSLLSDIDVCVGDDIELQCDVGNDKLEVEWFRDDTEIVDDSDQRLEISSDGKSRKLVVKGAQHSDTGTYTVKLKRFKDKKCSSIVNIHDYFVSVLSPTEAIEGEDVVLECEVGMDGIPVKWLRDDTEIDTSRDQRYKISSNGTKHVLKIIRAQCEDTGIYKVLFKEGECSSIVDVQDPFTSLLSDIDVCVGDDIELQCDIGTDKLEVEWFRDDTEIVDDGDQRLEISSDGKSRKLVVKGAQHSDTAHLFGNIIFTELEYTEELGNVSTKQFQDLAGSIGKEISELYNHLPGKQEVEILQLQPCVYIAIHLTTKNAKKLPDMVKNKSIPPYTVFEIEYARLSSNSYRIDVLLEYSDSFEDRTKQELVKEKVIQAFCSEDVTIDKTDFQSNYLKANYSLKTKDFHSMGKLFKVLHYEVTEGDKIPYKTMPILFPMKRVKRSAADKRTDLTDGIYTDEKVFLSYLINNFVARVGRELFDKEYPPQSLKDALSDIKHVLNDLKNKKEITDSQWQQMFPPQSEPEPSSETIEFKMLVRLIYYKKDKKTSMVDFQALSTLDYLTKGVRKLKYEEKELKKIIKLLKKIGGDKYIHIST